jgi:hypothetical protein
MLADKAASSPLMERIHRIRDIVLEHSALREIVSYSYIRNRLGCSEQYALWKESQTGVIGVFAASVFNLTERIRLKNDTVVSLVSYALSLMV